MRNNSLVTHWSLKLEDWVSTIKSIVINKLEIGLIGCRNGKFVIVDSFGTILFENMVDSWIGDIDYLLLDEELFVFIGTKIGNVYFFSIQLYSWVQYNESLIYEKKNTVRGVKTIIINEDYYLVVVGEDKCVDIFNIDDFKNAIFSKKLSVKYNGWLRCLEALPDKEGNYSWLCFGCGDKNIHFLNFLTQEKKQINVGYKTHTIKFLSDAQQLICCNDGNKLNVINWLPTKSSRIRINNSSDTYQRINTIERHEFGTSESNILLVGDFKTILTYNLELNQIIQAKFFRQHIHSLEPFLLQKSKRFLIGYGSRELCSINYSYELHESNSLSIINNIKNKDRLLYIDENTGFFEQENISENEFHNNIHRIYCGNILFKKQVGIGRFLFIVNYATENFIIVATDEGFVKILKLLNGDLVIYRTLKIIDVRIWSVAVNVKKNSIYIGTSNSKLIIYDWQDLIEDNKETIKYTHDLTDWPREIRPLYSSSNFDLCIGCEDGSIYLLEENNIEKVAKIDFTIRTISNSKNIDSFPFIIGTDQNCALSVDISSKQNWLFKTHNRVREIKIIDGFIYAVSEDRFLYKLKLNGQLEGKIKLPHRVLCIADHESKNQNIIFVGCGDGNIYELTRNLNITDCYRTFDRIRDIEIIEEKSILVAASEDNYLYVFEIKNHYLNRIINEEAGEFIQDFSQKCKLGIQTTNNEILDNFRIEDKFFLLRTNELWYAKINIPTLLYLIDSLIEDSRVLDILDFTYFIVKTLYTHVYEYDEKTALSRIEKIINLNNEYYNHSIWINLIELNKAVTTKLVINLIRLYKGKVTYWVNHEIARVLNVINFFDLENLESLMKLNVPLNSRFFNDILEGLDKLNKHDWIRNLIDGILNRSTEHNYYLSGIITIYKDLQNHKFEQQFYDIDIDIIEIAKNYSDKKIESKLLNILLKHYLKGSGEVINFKDYFILYALNKKNIYYE